MLSSSSRVEGLGSRLSSRASFEGIVMKRLKLEGKSIGYSSSAKASSRYSSRARFLCIGVVRV